MAPHEVLPKISADIRRLIEKHHAFYEVSPFYAVLVERTTTSTQRIQTGFEIDVYGMKTSDEPQPSAEYELAYGVLKQLGEMVRGDNGAACSIDAIPFRSTVILDTKNHFQPLTMLRITISHYRGLRQPAGAAELKALEAVKEQLDALGLRAGGWNG